MTSSDYGSLDYRNVRRIKLGRFEFDTWFSNSALFLPTEPELLAYKAIESGIKLSSSHRKRLDYDELKKTWIDTLHFCPYCFKYTEDSLQMAKHTAGCRLKSHLPGKVMYFDGDSTIRKIKASRHKLFCQCMCLLAKFFLDNKSIFFNIDYFDFYVIYKVLDGVSAPMGFYSRELLSWENNNLSCIMVIPCYQKQHLGTKLIDFSYCLSRYQQMISGPERPLSQLGRITYLRYWSSRLCIEFLYGSLTRFKVVTLKLISAKTGFREEDILMALDFMKSFLETGVKDPYTIHPTTHYDDDDDDELVLLDEQYRLYIDKSRLKQWVIDHQIKDGQVLKRDRLILY
ncbi:hypothetical protein FOA43_002137 [Brettanomyces nanus]|uniref:histone acetyltransferase n=1 Tax=Eeniella nana TaxID=13502 RepID=A0A875RZ41_EENNA|nr:uncharacterized protein FOA43_002137 [Brettanomyces nanus]QPG74801.1 hypothetical protein FOA43_002137 [Brettanomyces nanus]